MMQTENDNGKTKKQPRSKLRARNTNRKTYTGKKKKKTLKNIPLL